ncbi:MAG: hypothetical protein IMZ43_09750 [Thermoplasmata archaeon]|nr:hypothetical protein [Thermoplasmata archaeon]
MPTLLYDSLGLNADIVLDLPLTEGVGSLIHDVSKGHRNLTAVSAPVWTLAGDTMTLVFDGAADYLVASNASTTDLEFTSGDYSLCCWIDWVDTSTSENVFGRYELNVGGWELYFYGEILTLRHSHSLTQVGVGAHPAHHRSGCYSAGWTPGSGWCLLGVSRTGGGEAQMYRNGIALAMSTSGLVNPEATTSELIIGSRYDKTTDWYKGGMYRPRIWSRVLTASEWLGLYNKEVGLLP